MALSTHRVEVVPVTLESHPNADSLSIVHVFDGYTVIVKTDEWKDKTIAAYIPPDSLVPDTPEYEFLKGKCRIKAKKLRGEWSMGMLVPAPEGSVVGDDVAEQLGIIHYDPPESTPKFGGQACRAPLLPGFGEPINYDVESFRKYGLKVFEKEELVWVSEKIHGTNARFVYVDDKMWCGSHKLWKRPPEIICEDCYDLENADLWWRTLKQYPQLEKYCRENPNTVVYGEIAGVQKEMMYGMTKGQTRLFVFDIFENGKWVNAQRVETICLKNDIPVVPILGIYEFDFDELLKLAEGSSLVPGVDHLAEGIVIKPMRERWNAKCGRVNLKIVSCRYLERSK